MGKVLINYQGRELSLVEIAKMNHVDYALLRVKYHQTGDIEQAIKMAKTLRMGPRQYFDFAGQKLTINQIAQIYGFDYRDLQRAYKLTSDIDEAIDLVLNRTIVVNCGDKKLSAYQAQKDTESIHKLKNLTYTINEAGLKTDHTFLNNSVEPISTTEDKIMVEGLKKQIATLPPRLQEVLRLRYGLDDGVERSSDKVATILGRSRTGIEQIEREAFLKLKCQNKVYNTDTYEKFIEKIKQAVTPMPNDVRKVLYMIFGLADDSCYSYADVINKLGLTSDDNIIRIEKWATKYLPSTLRWEYERRMTDFLKFVEFEKSKADFAASILNERN